MNPSEAKELVGLLSERAAAWQALWTVFYTVSAAVVTLVASGKLLPRFRWIASAVAASGFLLFAWGNYLALCDLRQQRTAIVEYVKEQAKNSHYITEVAHAAAPPPQFELRLYHWGLCIFVVALIFAIPALQKPQADG